jgi:hypothetical protein
VKVSDDQTEQRGDASGEGISPQVVEADVQEDNDAPPTWPFLGMMFVSFVLNPSWTLKQTLCKSSRRDGLTWGLSVITLAVEGLTRSELLSKMRRRL